jgi:hypothetical protein
MRNRQSLGHRKSGGDDPYRPYHRHRAEGGKMTQQQETKVKHEAKRYRFLRQMDNLEAFVAIKQLDHAEDAQFDEAVDTAMEEADFEND